MAITAQVGSVTGLWRFPVKSMRGERLDEAHVTERGLVGDRAYALIDTDTGKVVSAKSVKRFPDLFGLPSCVRRAAGSGRRPSPRGDHAAGRLDRAQRHQRCLWRVVHVLSTRCHLARAAPEDFTIDQYHPDIEDVDPAGHRDTVVEQKLGAAFLLRPGFLLPCPSGRSSTCFRCPS